MAIHGTPKPPLSPHGHSGRTHGLTNIVYQSDRRVYRGLKRLVQRDMIATSEAMKTPYLILTAATFCAVNSPLMAQSDLAKSGSWSGVIINADCTLDEAFAEAAKCTEDRGPASKLVFYDDTIRQLYALDPPNQAAGHLGDAVTVAGELRGSTIKVASLKLLTTIGLNVGQKAPAFAARDQFGREQNLATLRGPRGTVILFFRSADW